VIVSKQRFSADCSGIPTCRCTDDSAIFIMVVSSGERAVWGLDEQGNIPLKCLRNGG
jgi:hypothetical protein